MVLPKRWPMNRSAEPVRDQIPGEVQDQIIEKALERSGVSPRGLAVRFTDEALFRVRSHDLRPAKRPMT